MQKMKLDPYITPFTKINLKWINDLNVRPETIKLLEESIAKNLDFGSDNNFLDVIPKALSNKSKYKTNGTTLNYWLKKKIFSTVKRNNQQNKMATSEWKKILVSQLFDKGLILKICKKFRQLNGKKPIQIKNGQKNWIDISPKKTYQQPTDRWKDAQLP